MRKICDTFTSHPRNSRAQRLSRLQAVQLGLQKIHSPKPYFLSPAVPKLAAQPANINPKQQPFYANSLQRSSRDPSQPASLAATGDSFPARVIGQPYATMHIHTQREIFGLLALGAWLWDMGSGKWQLALNA